MSDDWKDVLALECKRTSQSATAKRIGYSPAVVSQVLKGSYKGDESRVQQAVEGALMGLTVDCPVIGEIPRNTCLEYQRRPFAATNPTRVALSRACPTCPHYVGTRKS